LPFLLIFALTFLGRSWITQGTSAGFSFVDTPVQYRSDPWLRLATYLRLVGGFNHTFPLRNKRSGRVFFRPTLDDDLN